MKRCVVCIVICGLSFPSTLKADDKQIAKKHNRKAIKLFKERKYREAIVELEEAFRYHPSEKLLFNIATCHRLLKNHPKALEYYKRYLAMAPKRARYRARAERYVRKLRKLLSVTHAEVAFSSKPSKAFLFLDKKSKASMVQTPARRWVAFGPHIVFVEQEGYELLRKNIVVSKGAKNEFHFELSVKIYYGTLDIYANQRGFEVRLNGEFLGRTPVREVRVPEGQYKITIIGKEHKPYETVVQVSRDRRIPVRVTLERKPKKLTARDVGPWVGIGVGGASLIAAIALHAVAVKGANDANRMVEGKTLAELSDEQVQSYHSDFDSAKRKMTASYVLYGVASAALITSTVLLLVWRTWSGDKAGSSVSAQPYLDPRGTGINVQVTF